METLPGIRRGNAMKVQLVFEDWRDCHDATISVYNAVVGIRLSSGDFHSGTTFSGEIDLDGEQEEELREAMARGFKPVFRVTT